MKVLFYYRKGFFTLICWLSVVVIKAQICFMCSEERLLRLINNNESYNDYTVTKCIETPNSSEYTIFHKDIYILKNLK